MQIAEANEAIENAARAREAARATTYTSPR